MSFARIVRRLRRDVSPGNRLEDCVDLVRLRAVVERYADRPPLLEVFLRSVICEMAFTKRTGPPGPNDPLNAYELWHNEAIDRAREAGYTMREASNASMDCDICVSQSLADLGRGRKTVMRPL